MADQELARDFTSAERPEWSADRLDLFDPKTTKRVVAVWVASPTVAGVVAFAVFTLADYLRAFA